ncbi:hypothetical protein [Microviridae sp.]|nr:hypothetical protein [Microviridae sp.]
MAKKTEETNDVQIVKGSRVTTSFRGSYKVPHYNKSRLTSVDVVEGETIEQKIERITEQKEPITDGAPEIFTERKDGVVKAYNIRTDRWEVATDAMDAVTKSANAKRESKPEAGKVVDINTGQESEGTSDVAT